MNEAMKIGSYEDDDYSCLQSAIGGRVFRELCLQRSVSSALSAKALFALRPTLFALRSTLYALRPTLFALRS